MEIFVIWTAVAIVGAIVAKNRGRSDIGWFFLCLLLTPLAILVLLALPSMKPSGFEAEAFYKGTPYRPEAGGGIEAMLPGGEVNFRNMEEFTTAIDGGTTQLRTDCGCVSELSRPSPAAES